MDCRYGKTPLPETKIRITDSWVIGGDVLSYDNLFKKDYNLNLLEYQSAKYTKAVPVKNAIIWIDNPDKTKPVIIYTAQGLNTFKKRGTISNLTLKGSGIGILAAYTKKLFLDTVEFTGFENGLVLNNANFTTGKDLHFENCKRAEFDIRSHNSQFYNTTLALCEKGFEVRSNHIGIDGYYANLCGIGLHIASANNVIKRCYLEGKSTKPQLIIGEDKDGLKVNGNSFEALTIAAPGTTASYLGGNTYFGNKVGVNATDGATLTLPLTIWNNASGDAGLRIAQTGQNNWDFYNPTGQTYLGLRDVNGGTPYMTWLNGGNIGINTITPNSRFQINGSFAETLTAISASSTTVNANHDIFTCNANSNAQTFTVPTAVGITGRAYRFIKTDASANTVSIASTSSQTFSGPYYSSSTSYVLYNQGEEVTMRSDGANWVIESIMKGGLTTSSAGTLTLSYGKDYIFTGTTTTWTLPAVASTVFGRPNAITIKNQGSGAITLNTSGGGNDLYTNTSVNTITINAGESAFLLPDGTKINVE
jgi:hypothetical protein